MLITLGNVPLTFPFLAFTSIWSFNLACLMALILVIYDIIVAWLTGNDIKSGLRYGATFQTVNKRITVSEGDYLIRNLQLNMSAVVDSKTINDGILSCLKGETVKKLLIALTKRSVLLLPISVLIWTLGQFALYCLIEYVISHRGWSHRLDMLIDGLVVAKTILPLADLERGGVLRPAISLFALTISLAFVTIKNPFSEAKSQFLHGLIGSGEAIGIVTVTPMQDKRLEALVPYK